MRNEYPEEKMYYKWYFAEWIGDEEENAMLMNNLSEKLFRIAFEKNNKFEKQKYLR